MVGHRDVLEKPSTAAFGGRNVLERLSEAPQDFFSARYHLGGVAVEVRTADGLLLDALQLVLGRPSGGDFKFRLGLIVTRVVDGFLAEFDTDDARAVTTDDLLLGIGNPDFPFRLAGTDNGWTSFAWLEDEEPIFSFKGLQCRVREREGWRIALALLVLHRIYTIRTDAIFFHAATVDLAGQGVMIIGPKGRGKTTTSMALSARGHALLGDETACYLPASNELLPFRRPVGIKPGPRSRFIDRALEGKNSGEVLRVDFDDVLPGPRPQAVPLKAILLLEPFGDDLQLAEISPSTAEISLLQPVSSSFVNAPRTRRIFELGRMLSRSRVFRLTPADPDETAAFIEKTLGGNA